jgi:hypothetical protein
MWGVDPQHQTRMLSLVNLLAHFLWYFRVFHNTMYLQNSTEHVHWLMCFTCLCSGSELICKQCYFFYLMWYIELTVAALLIAVHFCLEMKFFVGFHLIFFQSNLKLSVLNLLSFIKCGGGFRTDRFNLIDIFLSTWSCTLMLFTSDVNEHIIIIHLLPFIWPPYFSTCITRTKYRQDKVTALEHWIWEGLISECDRLLVFYL